MVKAKSRAAATIFFVVFLCFAWVDKPKMVKVKVNNDISVLVPKEWSAMDPLDVAQRYPSVRKPLVAYTNEDRTADFSVNISATQWPDADLSLSQRFFKSSLLNMFDKVDIIGEGVREVNKRKFIYFEFESRLNGNRQNTGLKDPVVQYSYIQYLVDSDRTIVFSFHCPRRMREQWQETAHAIMDGITVKRTQPQQENKEQPIFSK